jgi:hypothetical protein
MRSRVTRSGYANTFDATAIAGNPAAAALRNKMFTHARRNAESQLQTRITRLHARCSRVASASRYRKHCQVSRNETQNVAVQFHSRRDVVCRASVAACAAGQGISLPRQSGQERGSHVCANKKIILDRVRLPG